MTTQATSGKAILAIDQGTTSSRAIVFGADQGRVFVIQDSQHDEIVDELMTRRKDQMLTWYGEVNLQSDLQSEINKFNWLQKEGVLTSQQTAQKIAEAEFSFKEEEGRPDDAPLN